MLAIEHHGVLAECGAQPVDVELLLEPVAVARVDDVIAVRRCIEHGAHALGDAEPPAHVRAGGVAVRAGQLVVARVAGLEHLALDRIGLADERRGETVGREDVLPVANAHVPLALEAPHHAAGLGHVETQSLERRAVPGLQARLIVAAAEPLGEVVVVDDVARGGERFVVLAAAVAERDRRGWDLAHPVPHDPVVLQGRAAADQLLVDCARVVGVLPAPEARVHDRVAQRRLAPRRIGGLVQPALVVGPPLVVVEVALDDERRLAVAPDAEREWLVVDRGRQRKVLAQPVADHHRRRVVTLDIQVPASAPQWQCARQRLNPRGGQLPLDPTARHPPRERAAVEVVARGEDQLHRAVGQARVACDREGAVAAPVGLGERGPRRPHRERRVALTRADERDLLGAARPRGLGRRIGHGDAMPPAALAQDELPRHTVLTLAAVDVLDRIELARQVGERHAGAPPRALHGGGQVEPCRAVRTHEPDLRALRLGHGELARELEGPPVEPRFAERHPPPPHVDRHLAAGQWGRAHVAARDGQLDAARRADVAEGPAPAPTARAAGLHRDVELPATLASQPAWVQHGAEARPLQVGDPLLLAGRHIRASGGGDLEAHPAVALAHLVQAPMAYGAHRHALGVGRRCADAADVRPTLHLQPPVDAAQVVDAREHAEVVVELEDRAGDPQPRVVAKREVAVPVASYADWRGVGQVLLLEPQHLEQLGQQAAADEVPLQPLDRRDLLERARADAVQERVDALDEDLAVALVGDVEHVEVVAEVVGDDAGVIQPLAPLLSTLGQEAADVLDGGEPVLEHLQLGAALGDRQVAVGVPAADPVVVDGLRDDVDRPRHELRGEYNRDVLVDDPLRETQLVALPERPPPQFVRHDPVGHQRPKALDVRLQPRALEGLGQKARLPRAQWGQPVHVSGGEVRARFLERADQELVGVARQCVVAVDERQELARGGRGAVVAGVAEPAVGLGDQPEARVVGGEALRDRRAVVGRAVVDHQHLEVAEGLPGDRLQAVFEVALDVVDRHHHADPGHGEHPRSTSRP